MKPCWFWNGSMMCQMDQRLVRLNHGVLSQGFKIDFGPSSFQKFVEGGIIVQIYVYNSQEFNTVNIKNLTYTH